MLLFRVGIMLVFVVMVARMFQLQVVSRDGIARWPTRTASCASRQPPRVGSSTTATARSSCATNRALK